MIWTNLWWTLQCCSEKDEWSNCFTRFSLDESITKNNWVIDEHILELVREHQIRLGNIHERKCLCSIWRWFCVAFICFKRCFYALIHCRRKHWFIFNWVDVNDCEWPALKWYDALGLSPLGYIPINYLNYPTNLSLSDSCIYIRSGICWRFFRVIYMQLYLQTISAQIYLLVIYFQRHWNNFQSKSIFVQFHFGSFGFLTFF